MMLRGRVIQNGCVEGKAIVSHEPIGFFGVIDPETGVVIKKGHALEGKSIKGKIFVFPTGSGSTVGSYILYRLKKNNAAPLAMINEKCEPIVAVGAIISEIPCVDKIDINRLKTGDKIKIDGERVIIDKDE